MIPLQCVAQNIGINVTGATPDNSALLDISTAGSANQGGLLIPRMTFLQRISIGAPAQSLLIFNTTSSRFEYWDAGWRGFMTYTEGWRLNGNTITSAITEFIGTTNNQDLAFRTNNTERGRINAAGFVGIGTNAPNRLLHVDASNTSTTDGQFRVRQLGTGDAIMHIGVTGRHYNLGIDNSDADKFKIGTTTGPGSISGNTLFTMQTDGYIGLGTTTPARQLDIEGTGEQFIRVLSTNNSDAGLELGSASAFGVDWQIKNGTGPLIIASDDFTTAAAPVDRYSFNVGAFTPEQDAAAALGGLGNRWTTVFAVNGTINTSDERDKQHIKNIGYGLNEVMQLRPVSFQWKAMPEEGTKLGLIAQELQDVLPEVVRDWSWSDAAIGEERKKVEAERMGVFYSDIIPVLVKAIQEQQKQIDQLRGLLE